MSTDTSLLRAIATACDRSSLATDSLLTELSLSRALLHEVDARVPTATYLTLFARAAKMAGPSFGVDVGKALDSACFGLVGFLVASSRNLREAFTRFCRYTRLLCNELDVQLVERGDDVAIVYTLSATERVDALFEMAFTHLVRSSRHGTDGAFRPLKVRFRHTHSAPQVEETLGTTIEHGATEDAVLCSVSSLALPLKGANAALLSVLESHAGHKLKALPDESNLVEHCRALIGAMLPDGEPSIETVARRMGKGARTLQRRLAEADVTFRTMVDEVRRERAMEALSNPQLSVSEIAFSLGFSDPTAFHHAFRRWTGRSPRSRT